MSAADELFARELEVDSHVAALPVLRLPLHALVVALDSAIHGLYQAGREGDAVALAKAEAAGRRFAYLAPLLARCPTRPFGLNGRDAFDAYREVDPDYTQLRELLSYAHFAELMPEVRRGYYSVTQSGPRRFVLRHRSEDFARSEIRDIVLAELALPYVRSDLTKMAAQFDDFAARLPQANQMKMVGLLATLTMGYFRNVIEPRLVDDAGYRAATGHARDDFGRFQAALLGLADFTAGVADALSRRQKAQPLNDELASELIEWKAVAWDWGYFVGLVSDFCGLPATEVLQLLEPFTLDFEAETMEWRKSGDGYVPPIFRLGGAAVFSPDLLRDFVHFRNVLFVLNRTNRRKFDELVSAHLEPALLEDAAGLFRRAGMRCATGVHWREGELDILVFDPRDASALHVEAKAAIPAEGARMVAALESRIGEGARQLQAFRDASPQTQMDVCQRAFGPDVRWSSLDGLLLSRSSFGTDTVWRETNRTLLANVPLLAGALRRNQESGRTLAEISSALASSMEEALAAAAPAWRIGHLAVAGLEVEMPLLDLNPALGVIRAALTLPDADLLGLRPSPRPRS